MWPLWEVLKLKLETMTQFIHFAWKPKISKAKFAVVAVKMCSNSADVCCLLWR